MLCLYTCVWRALGVAQAGVSLASCDPVHFAKNEMDLSHFKSGLKADSPRCLLLVFLPVATKAKNRGCDMGKIS